MSWRVRKIELRRRASACTHSAQRKCAPAAQLVSFDAGQSVLVCAVPCRGPLYSLLSPPRAAALGLVVGVPTQVPVSPVVAALPRFPPLNKRFISSVALERVSRERAREGRGFCSSACILLIAPSLVIFPPTPTPTPCPLRLTPVARPNGDYHERSEPELHRAVHAYVPLRGGTTGKARGVRRRLLLQDQRRVESGLEEAGLPG